MFTKQRLALLQTLGDKSFESVRKLANHLGRDVHNVYEDVQLFRKLGLVDFDSGSRICRVARLLADSVTVDSVSSLSSATCTGVLFCSDITLLIRELLMC